MNTMIDLAGAIVFAWSTSLGFIQAAGAQESVAGADQTQQLAAEQTVLRSMLNDAALATDQKAVIQELLALNRKVLKNQF